MDFKSTPFDQAVAELSVKENQDPYLVFFYLRTLMEALFLRFNSNPEHVAVLDATPMDYSYGFSLVWEGDPPKVVPLTVEEVVSKFHNKELFLEFADQFKDGMPLYGMVDFMADRLQRNPAFAELSRLAVQANPKL